MVRKQANWLDIVVSSQLTAWLVAAAVNYSQTIIKNLKCRRMINVYKKKKQALLTPLLATPCCLPFPLVEGGYSNSRPSA